mmetsp:Transcript_7879/g.9023  ORF Transcript_7879/g.9023 Transcript_7879/m.9023 type:complete len:103 (-) Transcript_7879:13-321(-)
MVDTLSTVRENFVSNIEGRGLEFSFMWVNTNLQTEWPTTFDIVEFPQVIVLNHGKKKKFMKHQGELVTESSLSALLNQIIGGNGRFKRVQDNKLPALNDMSN